MLHNPPAMKVEKNEESWRKKECGRREGRTKEGRRKNKKRKKEEMKKKRKDGEKKASSIHKSDFDEDFSA